MNRSRNGLLALLSAIFVAIYVGSYFLIITPRATVRFGDHHGNSTTFIYSVEAESCINGSIGQRVSRQVFEPLVKGDRILRPAVWGFDSADAVALRSLPPDEISRIAWSNE